MKLLVLDVMPLLYRGHFALLNRPRITSSGFNASALFVFANIVHDLLSSRDATHAAFAMDTSPTFRHERYPLYKAKREKLPEDISARIGPAEDFAKALRIPFLRIPGYEADDIMGTLARRADAAGFTTWLVTPDKDLAQLVTGQTFLCRPSKSASGNEELYDVKRVCEEWHINSPAQMVDYLAIAGDAADNIPGFPGIGPKGAASLLEKFGSLDEIISRRQEIPGKTGRIIAEHVELGKLSRELAQINCEVPIPLTLDELAIQEPDLDAVEAFCARYELNTLLRRYKPDAKPIEPPPVRSLFAGTKDAPAAESPAQPETPFDTVDNTPHEYTLVLTHAQLDALASSLAAVPRFAFDTETTGLDPRTDRPVGISFATAPGHAWYVPLADLLPGETSPENDLFSSVGLSIADDKRVKGTPASGVTAAGAPLLTAADVRRALAPVFANPSIEKIGHNAKFDLHVLRQMGIEVQGPVSDTMLAHYVIDPTTRHGMDPLAREYLHYNPIPIESLIGPHGKDQKNMRDVPIDAAGIYGAEDADVTLRLYGILSETVREKNAWRVWNEAENPLVPILAEMEDTGVCVDRRTLETFGRELQSEIASIRAEIETDAGESFNIDSPVQLASILFDKLKLPSAGKTATGKISTAEDVLQSIAHLHPIVPKILEYRACTKLKSTYVDKLPQCFDPRDGRVHTSFHQALTETGRLSSERPNLQNIPIRTERGKRIRAAIVASSPDHVLLSADYSQIELRMVAHLSGDEHLIDAFRHDADIHRQTAALVYGIPPEEVTKEQRASCKQVNFGIIYGISAFGLAQRIGCSRATAADMIQTYFERFPKIRAFMEKTIEQARSNGYVTTILGRRRPLRDIASRNGTVRAGAERNAINTPVQGSAADLIKLAMVRVAHELRTHNLSAKLLLQVHDELLLDVPKTEADAVSKLVRDAMENAMELSVPLKTDIGIGTNWLEAH